MTLFDFYFDLFFKVQLPVPRLSVGSEGARGTKAGAYCIAMPLTAKCQGWESGMGGSSDHKATEGPPPVQDHLPGEGGGGDLLVSRSHLSPLLCHLGLHFSGVVCLVPGADSSRKGMHSQSKGQHQGPHVCGLSLGTAGQAGGDDRGGVAILSQPSIQEIATQIAWPCLSQVPRSSKGGSRGWGREGRSASIP